MGTKLIDRSVLFAIIAFVLFFFAFTFPSVLFYKVPDKIKSGNTESISKIVYPFWDLYQIGRYVSPYTPRGAEKNLKMLIERRGEIGVMSMPIWAVSLEAPNYPKESFPKGIPVYFHIDGYSGDVHEMNTINHFIGMYPMERGAQLERALAPFLTIIVAVCIFVFIFYKGRFSWLLMVPSAVFPFAFFVLYSAWLYWYGHNLQDWGMFKVKPFMPTALGDGKVAQFTTHSYPAVGFYILVIVAVLSIFSIISRSKSAKNVN